MKAARGSPLYYWTSEREAEVDFLVEYDGGIFPLEAKSGSSTKKKSLLVYSEKYHPPMTSRATLRNLKRDGNVCNYPLYFVSQFPLVK